MSTKKDCGLFNLDIDVDPAKTSNNSILAVCILIGVAIGGMVVSSFAPNMRDMVILLVALIFLAMAIWYLIYSVRLYRQAYTPKNSLLIKAYDRLLTAIGN
jgi:hypothetical protein